MKISIILPVFNEGVNLKIILRIIQAIVKSSHEVLVVYDFPEDNSISVTQEIQKTYPEIGLVYNDKGRGAINAIKKGVEEAKGKYAITLMADDIGPIFAIDAMADLMDKGCELVSCTRYGYGGKVFGGSWIQKILSKTANKLFYFLSSSQLTDVTFGPKMFRPDFFKKITIESKRGWAVAFELSIKAQVAGLQVGEVPITSINRFYGGKETFYLGSWLTEYLKWFLRGLRELRNIKNLPQPLYKKAFE